MSIIISGMKMPKCCIDCPIYDNEFGQCNLIPNSTFYGDGFEIYDPLTERNENCPLRLDFIENAPTVEERPQGEWLVVGHDDTTYWYRCSICEYEEHDNFTKHYQFCPNCGANMRKERKNDS